MTIIQSLTAFIAAATLLTITPGLDTALVMRTGVAEGMSRGAATASGILIGGLIWGALVAVGLGALVTASPVAYAVLKWAGAAYLAWLGLNLLFKPRRQFESEAAADGRGGGSWLAKGLLTNLLNPKVGVFYVTFLPQFVPAGVEVAPYVMLLAVIHAALSVVWFGMLLGATTKIAGVLRRPGVITAIDRLTGGVLLAFGARLAFASKG